MDLPFVVPTLFATENRRGYLPYIDVVLVYSTTASGYFNRTPYVVLINLYSSMCRAKLF